MHCPGDESPASSCTSLVKVEAVSFPKAMVEKWLYSRPAYIDNGVTELGSHSPSSLPLSSTTLRRIGYLFSIYWVNGGSFLMIPHTNVLSPQCSALVANAPIAQSYNPRS